MTSDRDSLFTITLLKLTSLMIFKMLSYQKALQNLNYISISLNLSHIVILYPLNYLFDDDEHHITWNLSINFSFSIDVLFSNKWLVNLSTEVFPTSTDLHCLIGHLNSFLYLTMNHYQKKRAFLSFAHRNFRSDQFSEIPNLLSLAWTSFEMVREYTIP